MRKIYIVGHRNIDTLSIGKELQSRNDSLTIAPFFNTNDVEEHEYEMFIDKETVNISYKNNSVLTMITDVDNSRGIMYDDFYNNDIICINLYEFNIISDKILCSPEFHNIIVWVDSRTNVHRDDIKECEFFNERLLDQDYLYFIDNEPVHIVDVIISFLNGTDDVRKELLEEYS